MEIIINFFFSDLKKIVPHDANFEILKLKIFICILLSMIVIFTALIGLWDTHNLLSENAKITASNFLH